MRERPPSAPPADQDDALDVDALRGDLVDAVRHRASKPSTPARATLAEVRFRVVTPCSAPVASGKIRRAFALEVRHQRQPSGTRGRRQRQPVQFVEVHAEHRRHRRQHRRAVERADQRQLSSGGVGEAGHDPLRVVRCGLTDRAHDTGGAQRDDAVAGFGAEAQRRRRVVARARAQHRAADVRPATRAGPAPSAARAAVPASPARAGRGGSCRSPRRSIRFRWRRCGRCAASPISVDPLSRQVSQSCGRHTAAVASA